MSETTAIPVVGMETKREVLSRASRRLREQVAAHGITSTTLTLLSLYERRYRIASGEDATLDGIRMDCLNRDASIGALCHREEGHIGPHSTDSEGQGGLTWTGSTY